MLTGLRKVGDYLYYFDKSSGKRIYGELEIEDQRWYFNLKPE